MRNDSCPACGQENDTEDEYCHECTKKHNLGKEAVKSGRYFYKKVYTVTVLSDEPVSFDDLPDIHYAITEGHCVGTIEESGTAMLDGKQMADALTKAGSDPGFFRLTEEGKDDDES